MQLPTYIYPKFIKLRVFIIGSGNVAVHLSRALRKTSATVSGIMSRNMASGAHLASKCNVPFTSTIGEIPIDLDLYLICVADDAIQTVCDQLPIAIRENKVVAHTSGSKSIDVLKSAKRHAVFYPLQTFSAKRRMSYSKIPFCIDAAQESDRDQLLSIASQISEITLPMGDTQRKKAHLAGVMINNFVNHLIYKAENIVTAEGLPAEILNALLTETVRKARVLGSHEAQTGPARRGDNGTISSQIAQLDEVDRKLYIALSESIANTYQ